MKTKTDKEIAIHEVSKPTGKQIFLEMSWQDYIVLLNAGQKLRQCILFIFSVDRNIPLYERYINH